MWDNLEYLLVTLALVGVFSLIFYVERNSHQEKMANLEVLKNCSTVELVYENE